MAAGRSALTPCADPPELWPNLGGAAGSGGVALAGVAAPWRSQSWGTVPRRPFLIGGPGWALSTHVAGGAGTPGPSARLWRFSDHPRGVGDVVDGTGVVELAGGDDGADRAGSFLALAGAEAAGESKEGGKLAGCQTCAHDPRNGVWT